MTPSTPKSVKRKLYLTKGRKKAVELELSINDVLYRWHEQKMQKLNEYARHLEGTYKNVIQVRSKDVEGNIYLEEVIDVQKVDGEGLVITIHRFD